MAFTVLVSDVKITLVLIYSTSTCSLHGYAVLNLCLSNQIVTTSKHRHYLLLITTLFNNLQTLKFKIQPTIMLFTAVNHCSRPLRKHKRLAQRSQDVIFVHCDWWISIQFVGFCIFVVCRFTVPVIIIDGSKTHNLLVGVEVQSPYVIERRSNKQNVLFTISLPL